MIERGKQRERERERVRGRQTETENFALNFLGVASQTLNVVGTYICTYANQTVKLKVVFVTVRAVAGPLHGLVAAMLLSKMVDDLTEMIFLLSVVAK